MFEEGTNFKFLADTLADGQEDIGKTIDRNVERIETFVKIKVLEQSDRLTDQTKAIVDGMTILQDQYDGITEAFNGIRESLQQINGNLATIDKRLTALEH